MKSRLGAALAIISVVLVMAGTAGATTPAHYTDGTTFDGQTNYGPPPLPPGFSTPCQTAIVDPSSFVFVTLHFVYGSTMPPATVPVHDDAADVVNYAASVPGTFLVDVSSFVAGKTGFLAYTWNIGTGVTSWASFDCTPPPSSTTTSIATEGSTIASSTTTTSVAPTGSTVTDPGTTSTTSAAVLGTTQLPFTGGDTGPLTFVAAVLLASGAVLTTRARKRTRK